MAVKTSDFKLKDSHIIVDCRQEVTKTQPPYNNYGEKLGTGAIKILL